MNLIETTTEEPGRASVDQLPEMPASGWYTDPARHDHWRYWEADHWTDESTYGSDHISPRPAIEVENEHFLRVASYKTALLACLLATIVVAIAAPLLIGASVLTALLLFLTGLALTVSIFLLALELHDTFHGVVLGFLGLVPLLGLLVAAVLVQKANALSRSREIMREFDATSPLAR